MKKRKFIFNISALKPRRQDLRHKSTQSEKILWQRIRNNLLGPKFFRQYSVEGYVLDFYCPEKRLAIEIEGSIHGLKESKIYDSYRYKYLEAFNIKFLKFKNQDIFLRIGSVIDEIKSALSSPS